MGKEDLGFNFGRHTERLTDVQSGEQIRKESEGYKGVSEHGVELSREIAADIKNQIDASPANTVFFIGGSSEEPRTKSTDEIYGDTLATTYADDANVIVLTRSNIDTWASGASSEKQQQEAKNVPYASIVNAVSRVSDMVRLNPNKKIVVSYPLFLKEFSLRPDFREKEAPHNLTAYSKAIQPPGISEQKAVENFLQGEGSIINEQGEIIRGSSGQDVAEGYLRGVKRLREFAKKYAPDRPFRIEFVSHGLMLDALASYLAHAGKADIEGFKMTGNEMIQSSERGEVEIKGETAVFKFRGKEFEVPKELLEAE